MNHDSTDKLRGLLDGGVSVESALFELRMSGASKVDSIVAVHDACGLDLAEGKKMVHLSSAWADLRERDDQFHESVECVVNSDDVG